MPTCYGRDRSVWSKTVGRPGRRSNRRFRIKRCKTLDGIDDAELGRDQWIIQCYKIVNMNGESEDKRKTEQEKVRRQAPQQRIVEPLKCLADCVRVCWRRREVEVLELQRLAGVYLLIELVELRHTPSLVRPTRLNCSSARNVHPVQE
jgi:hypothetical protein